MSDIFLLFPPIEFRKDKQFNYPPLGILYVGTFLKEKGFDVKVIDCEIERHSLDKLKEIIIRENPSIVGFSSMTCQIRNTLIIAKAIKQQNKNIKIICGGPHISSTIGELFKFTNDIDFLVYGEGEHTSYELIKALKERKKDFRGINGIIFKENNKVVVTRPRDHIENLDGLPFPDLSLVKTKRYDAYYAKSLPLTSIMASRGCPFNCNFCDAYATHGRKIRFRSPKNVVNEMEHNYRKFGIRQFMIKDSTFTIKKDWVNEICNELKARKLKINWTCNTRVDMVNEPLLKNMKFAGCYMVLFGIESGSQKVLNNMMKATTVEQTKHAIKLCKKVGLGTVGFFMIGNPGETKEDVEITIKLSKELDLDLATFGVTIAYPNTELYRWGVRSSVIKDPYWYMKEQATKSKGTRTIVGNLDMEDLSVDDQLAFVKKAIKKFYFRPCYIIKRMFSIKNFLDLKRNLKAVKELL